MKIKKGSKLITLIGLCLFVFMLSSLLMMSKTLQNSELFDRFYLALLLFNTLGLVSLSHTKFKTSYTSIKKSSNWITNDG